MEVSQIESSYNHQAQRFLLDAPSSFRAANFNCHHPACARLYRVGQDRPGELFSRVAENSNTNLNQLSWAINMVCVCLAPSLHSLLLVCSEDSLLNSLRCSLPVVGFDSDSSSSSCQRSLFYYWHFHVAATGDRRHTYPLQQCKAVQVSVLLKNEAYSLVNPAIYMMLKTGFKTILQQQRLKDSI